jgi:hypothetical protein
MKIVLTCLSWSRRKKGKKAASISSECLRNSDPQNAAAKRQILLEQRKRLGPVNRQSTAAKEPALEAQTPIAL